MATAHSLRSGGLKWLIVIGALLATLALAATLAGAAPVPGTAEVPRIAIVATAGNFPDSLVAGPIAGALGGIVVLTPTESLASEAEDTLVAFDPDLVYIAGGTAAISAAVEAAVDAAGPWSVERKAGPSRIQTAAALNEIFDDLGVDRPALLADGQVIGNATIGGKAHVDSLEVENDTIARGVAVFGARVGADGKLRGWFNNAGGEPDVNKTGTGAYVISVPGVTLDADNFAASATTATSVNQIGVDFTGGGNVTVGTRDHAANAEDATFHVLVFEASTDG